MTIKTTVVQGFINSSDFLLEKAKAKMSFVYYRNPQWLRDAAGRRARGRLSVGAFAQDYKSFEDLIKVRVVRFGDDEAVMLPDSKVIVDIDTKEYRNEGNVEDKVKINGQKSEKQKSSKNHQLSVGKTVGNTINFGLNASFFNIGGIGLGLGVGGSRTNEKREENKRGEENEEELGKEYGVNTELQIPPKTKVVVRITTYSVTYRAENVEVEVSAPKSALLRVKLAPRKYFSCFFTNQVFINTTDYLQSLNEEGVIQEQEDMVYIRTTSHLSYLGEMTVVSRSEKELTS